MLFFSRGSKLKMVQRLIIPVILPFMVLACSSTEELITRPPNFQPESYAHPNEYGIKNATEFLKKPGPVIEDSKFVPPKVEGGIEDLMTNVKFPYEARQQFQEGKVMLNIFVNQKGDVRFVRVLSSPDNRLSRYSIMAIKHTDFLPATLNDKPVKSTRLLMFVYEFKLDNEVNY